MVRVKENTVCRFAAIIWLCLCVSGTPAFAQSTGFTYQGRLTDNNLPANANYDFEFRLFDAVTAGTQQGATITLISVAVTNGIFAVTLDFGVCATCFNGATRFLEIRVKPTSGGTFTTLSPRQPLTSTPYAIKSLNATTADGLSLACVNCVTSSQIQDVQGSQITGTIAGSQISGTIPVASVPAGSANYIQNRTTPQGTSNFNISGDGTVGGTLSGAIVNATTQYNLGDTRILSNAGIGNLFAGGNAGQVNTGNNNAFFGSDAGRNNLNNDNAFFGSRAGFVNSQGNRNSFFGSSAGRSNTIGSENAFFGFEAGLSNTEGGGNSFFGYVAGNNTTISAFNSFFGNRAGSSNTEGSGNTFIGKSAGDTNMIGSNNTILGYNADVASNNLANATAIGYRAFVENNDALVLGSVNGKNGATVDTKVGIGTTSPNAPLDIEAQNTATHLSITSYGGPRSKIRGRHANGTRTAPTATQNDNRLLEIVAEGYTGSAFSTGATLDFIATENWTPGSNGTRIELRTTANGSGGDLPRITIENNGNVGIGTLVPARILDVFGNVRVGTGTTGCVEDRDGTVIAGTCASDLRFKKNITPFAKILHHFTKLRPVNFFWRTEEFADKHFGNQQSFGLIAQEVEPLFPDLVSTDEQGYKVVNYSKLPLLTIQAVNELKAENDALHQQVAEQKRQVALQQQQLDALRKLLCQNHPQAEVCK